LRVMLAESTSQVHRHPPKAGRCYRALGVCLYRAVEPPPVPRTWFALRVRSPEGDPAPLAAEPAHPLCPLAPARSART
jgi:hypothetical protein